MSWKRGLLFMAGLIAATMLYFLCYWLAYGTAHPLWN